MKVTVLLSLAPPDGTLRYVVHLTDGKAPGTRYKYFSWWTALFGKYDVFHVHWPEQLVRGGNTFVRTTKRLLARLLLLRLRISRIALVRTLHNLRPHEPGDAGEDAFLNRLDSETDLYIRLNPATPMDESRGVTILHGHYIGRYPTPAVTEPEPGRILYFGLIRPYKGVERLIEVFESIQSPELKLRIVGKPTVELRRLVEFAVNRNPRISSLLEFVADDVLAAEVYRAQLVVLPYREMHNSGAILVALSLGRPVLVPRSVTNELLAAEVGPNWVNIFDGELTKEAVLSAVKHCPRRDSAPPKLGGRDWDVVGQKHYEAYLRAMLSKNQAPPGRTNRDPEATDL